MKPVVDASGNIIPGIMRDTTGALVVTDKNGLDKYRKKRQSFQEQQQKISTLEQELESLKVLVNRLIQEKQ